jgi:hypothetical protein
MHHVEIIERDDPRRAAVEAFVKDVYRESYGAAIAEFADRLLCRFGADADILCVAGLRLAEDGFFSEIYLSEPVETALSRVGGYTVHRDDVYEVTTLVSRSPRDLALFIDDIIAFGARHGLSWSFFTLTQRLSLLVRRRGLAPILLADADPGRVADPAAWGRYYATEPKVYGVCGLHLLRALAPERAEARLARGL